MSPNFARGAAMLCQQPLFRDFVTHETGEAIADEAQAASALRRLCGVESRRDLIAGTPAGERYLQLVEGFNAWLRRRGNGVGS